MLPIWECAHVLNFAKKEKYYGEGDIIMKN